MPRKASHVWMGGSRRSAGLCVDPTPTDLYGLLHTACTVLRMLCAAGLLFSIYGAKLHMHVTHIDMPSGACMRRWPGNDQFLG